MQAFRTATMLLTGLFLSDRVMATCGAINYAQGTDALVSAYDFVVLMMTYVVSIAYVIAAMLALVSALEVYLKINYQEQDVRKSIVTLFMSCLFMLGVTIVFPAFFGFTLF